jgi:hypothetical protein
MIDVYCTTSPLIFVPFLSTILLQNNPLYTARPIDTVRKEALGREFIS